MSYLHKYLTQFIEDLADVFEKPEIDKHLIYLANNFSRDNLPNCFLKLIELSTYLLEVIRSLTQCNDDISDHKYFPKYSKDGKEDQITKEKKRRVSLKTHGNHLTQFSIDDIPSIMLQNIFSHFDNFRLLINYSIINKRMQKRCEQCFLSKA